MKKNSKLPEQVENVGREVAKKIVAGRKRIDLDRQIKLIEKNNVTPIPFL